MDCRDIHNRIQAWLDNTLDPDELAETRKHLRSCARCRREHRMFLLMSQGLQQLPLESPSRDFNRAVWERLGLACQERKKAPWMGWSLAGGISLLASWLLALGVGAVLIASNLKLHQLILFIRHPDTLLHQLAWAFMSLGLRLYQTFSFAAKILGWIPASQLPLTMMFSSLLAMVFIALAMNWLRPINHFHKL